MVDTVPGDLTSTAVVPVGQSIYGTIDTAGDHDWYRVDLVAGQTYQFRLHGMGTGQLRDPTLVLRNSAGAFLSLNDDAGATRWGGANGLDSFIQFTASSSGTYFLDVGDFNDDETGNFLLTAVVNNPAGMVFTNDEIAWQIVNNYTEAPIGGGNTRPFAWNVAAGGSLTVNITGLTADGQTLARNALRAWTDVTGIAFVETSGTAQITFDDNASGVNAFTNWSATGGFITSATVQITTGWLTQFGTGFQSYSYETYIHEIGHALGLGHGGNYNGSATYGTDNYYLNDSLAYSIMSYMQANGDEFGSPMINTFVPADFRYMLTPAMVDIIAVHNLYSGSTSTRTGNTTYGFNSNTGNAALDAAVTIGADMFMTVYDDGGNDTLDFSGTSATQSFNLNQESFSDVLGGLMNLSIARGVLIENAIGGSGSDTFTGNAANNTFTGNGGLDTVVFNGNRNQFSFIETDNYVANEGAVGGGTDTLNGIERFVFNDVTVVDDGIGGTSTTDAIAAGGSATGDIQFLGDRDWFSAPLTAGHRYVIDVHGSPSGGGTLSDTYLRLHNAAGAQVALDDDSGLGFESMLAVRAGAGGNFFLDVGSYFDSSLGTYTMTLEDVGTGTSRFENAEAELAAFGTRAGGWTSDNLYPRELADVNGDSLADIVGFSQTGVVVSLATGSANFASATFNLAAFGPGAGGWSSEDRYPRHLADVNGDHLADIVGFGAAGVYVSLATGGGNFAPLTFSLAAFGANAGGWSSDDSYPRELADVNGDGRADIVGFGAAGVYVSLATGGGNFAAPTFALATFGASAGGWSSEDRYPRHLADVNGDHLADIVGFGAAGVYVSLATGGGNFAAPTLALASFGAGASAGGWFSDDRYPRELADVNADGLADIVGFGEAGVYVSLATGGGAFAAPTFELANYAHGASGWTSDNLYPRELADVNGDFRADIIGFGSTAVYSSPSHDFILV